MVDHRLPAFLKPYFWDVDFEKISADSSAEFIINRLLNYAGLAEAIWVKENYPEEVIKKVLKTKPDFSLKNASFWGMVYGISRQDLKCFQAPYYHMRKELWPY
jgi:hypothetical protein